MLQGYKYDLKLLKYDNSKSKFISFHASNVALKCLMIW